MSRRKPEQTAATLEIRLLGEPAVLRAGSAVALPQSRKTRALLAYLVATGRPQRREKLCDLLWDITDDPRAALRWSLTKLRPVLNDPGAERLVAGREHVEFRALGARVDLLDARQALRGGVAAIATGRLQDLAEAFRGEFLEGLELPDFLDFRAWCATQREDARALRAGVLRELLARRRDDPPLALPVARALVQADPSDEEARVQLIQLLQQAGRPLEVEQQLQAARRISAELGAPHSPLVAAAARRPEPTPAQAQPASPGRTLVGRQAETATLRQALESVARSGRSRILLVTGEPGLGKTRLIEELPPMAAAAGVQVLAGRAFELERQRPWGPWQDALRRLAPGGMPGLAAALDDRAGASRDALFAAVLDQLQAASRRGPLALVFDDLHFFDEASVALLHYVARMTRDWPVLLVLAARPGELPDNGPAHRLARALRVEESAHELPLAPLDEARTAEIARSVNPQADAALLFRESRGNPLIALELARALRESPHAATRSVNQSVRDRVDRLPPAAGEVLRWCAVLGASIAPGHLAGLVSMDADALLGALDTLERHGLLRAWDSGYVFAHDLLRRAVYAELSEPRRRLMHWRVFGALQKAGADAAEIARHAALAGENEAAACACLEAGRRALRVFAGAEAFSLAARGLQLAAALPQPARTELQLQLHEVSLAARRPDDAPARAAELEQLAAHAHDLGCLEPARLGFHLAAWLRWEAGQWDTARSQMRRAEQAGRGADPARQALALADAARCLVLLERDLPQAGALLLESRALARDPATEPVALVDTEGMLAARQGDLPRARARLDRACDMARRAGDHREAFLALEHRVMLELDHGDPAAAAQCADEIKRLAARLEGGTESAFAAALCALARLLQQDDGAAAELDAACDALRGADAKFRLAWLQSRAALYELARGRKDPARARAAEALQLATALERPSETAIALAVLAACGGPESGPRRDQALQMLQRPLSARAARAVNELLAPPRERAAKRRK